MKKFSTILLVLIIALIFNQSVSANPIDWKNKQAYYTMPVLFIHGINSNANTWVASINALKHYYSDKYQSQNESILHPIGWPATAKPPAEIYLEVYNYGSPSGDPNDTSGSFNHLDSYNHNYIGADGQQKPGLSETVEGILANYYGYNWKLNPKAKIIIVAHSQGGLIARWYKAHGGEPYIERLITIGTPNTGSFNGSLLYKSIKDPVTITEFITGGLTLKGLVYIIGNRVLTKNQISNFTKGALEDIHGASGYLTELNNNIHSYPDVCIWSLSDAVVGWASQKGLGVFTLPSDRYIQLYLTPHAAIHEEPKQWDAFLKAMDGIPSLADKPEFCLMSPQQKNIYTTKIRLEYKTKDYLPASLTSEAWESIGGSSFGTIFAEKKVNYANSDYLIDGYRGIRYELYSTGVIQYDTDFALKLQLTNSGQLTNEMSSGYTYTCLVSSTTPADNAINVPLNSEIKIVFEEKIRRETFEPANIGFNDGNTSVLYNTTWIDEKTVKLEPYGPLSPDTQYTITLKGDKYDLATYDINYPTSSIQGIQYYLNNASIGEDNADKHGFDPDYTFTFNTGSNSGGGAGGGGFPGGGHPDDNNGVETGTQDPQPVEGEVKAGILGNGFYYDTYVMLSGLNINTRLIRLNNLDMAFQYPVLVIPTAGLYGLDNSATFKKKLADYVTQGGTIICYTQQYGQEFSALPGGQIVGFGWEEDQACWGAGAVYINEVSAVFNGQSSATPSVNVDGYFTKWPENAKILLNRGKNGLPDLIESKKNNGVSP